MSTNALGPQFWAPPSGSPRDPSTGRPVRHIDTTESGHPVYMPLGGSYNRAVKNSRGVVIGYQSDVFTQLPPRGES